MSTANIEFWLTVFIAGGTIVALLQREHMRRIQKKRLKQHEEEKDRRRWP